MNSNPASKESLKKINLAISKLVKEYLDAGMVLDAQEACNVTGGLLFFSEKEKMAYRVIFDIKTTDKGHDYYLKVFITSEENGYGLISSKGWKELKSELVASD